MRSIGSGGRIMRQLFGILMMGLVVGVGGCGGDSDNPTGPQGQKLELEIVEWGNGNFKVKFL